MPPEQAAGRVTEARGQAGVDHLTQILRQHKSAASGAGATKAG
jgi:hypothetical protein